MGGEYLSVSDKLHWVLEWTDLKLNPNLETRTYSRTRLTLPHIHPSPHTQHTLEDTTVTDKKENPMMRCQTNINSLEWVKLSCTCEFEITQYVRISSYFILLIYPPSNISPPSLNITAWKWNYVSFNVLVWSNLTVTMRKHWQRQVHLSKQWFPLETSHKTVKLVLLWWNQFSLHVLISIWCVYLVKYITFHC